MVGGSARSSCHCRHPFLSGIGGVIFAVGGYFGNAGLKGRSRGSHHDLTGECGVNSLLEKIVSMGTRITSIDDLIGKATPVERRGLPKAVVRL